MRVPLLKRIVHLNTDTNNNSWAIITPSYEPDHTRCQLLCKSIDTFVEGDWHHYIIVSFEDLALFSSLAGPKRSIVEKQTLLPKGMVHLPRLSKLANSIIRFISFSIWFSWSTGFLVGWQVQQLIKIEMACRVKELGIMCCDSDMFFIKKFQLSKLNTHGRFRFWRSSETYSENEISNPRYIATSAKILGLKQDVFPVAVYVGPLVTWHRPTVLAMRDHISKIARTDWRVALAKYYHLSEYSLYGLFVDRVLEDASHLQTDHRPLVCTIWHRTTMNDAALSKFCDEIADFQVAVCVQSFAGISVDRTEVQFQRAVDLDSKRRRTYKD